MLRGVDIDAIGARYVVLRSDAEVVREHVLAVEDEQAPDRLIVQVQASDMHVPRVLNSDQSRSSAARWACHGRSRSRSYRRSAGGSITRSYRRALAAEGVPLHPLFARSIDRSLTRNLEIGHALCVDEGRGPHLLCTFPARLYLRVVIRVSRALEYAVLLHQQVHALLEKDGPAKEHTLRDDHNASAGGSALIDSCLDRLCIHGRPVRHRSVVRHHVALTPLHGCVRCDTCPGNRQGHE